MENKFIEIYNLYKDDIYHLAFSYTKSMSDADDVIQNVFVKLYKHYEILDTNNINIKKWLIKVTINECKTMFLSSWKRKMIFFKDNEEENIKYTSSKNEQLINALMTIKSKYRIVVYLYYYEGYKTKEISELLNISEVNTRARLTRGREQLKDILKKEWDYD